MVEKLTKKQLKAIKKYRKDNPKETTHERRAKILKNKPWWLPRD
tara:strand:+ start:92 stop:223 length:132 start_codon:yes stop_codon:yes gene_type:complete